MIATAKDVRAWAQENYVYPVNPRGRVPKHIWDAYLEVHPEASN